MAPPLPHPALPFTAAAAALPCCRLHATCTPGCRALCRLAYDGRGNAVVRSEADIPAAVESLGGYDKGLYAEK